MSSRPNGISPLSALNHSSEGNKTQNIIYCEVLTLIMPYINVYYIPLIIDTLIINISFARPLVLFRQ
jgi:hypothetical protein